MIQAVDINPDAVFDDGSLHIAMGLSPSAIARARREGHLRYRRIGKRTLYLGKWILEWLDCPTEEAGQ